MTLQTASDLVSAFSNQRVLVVGDLMLDEYVWGTVRRISPEAPVPVLEVARQTCSAGGAANAAANVVSLGGHVALAGVVGADEGADRLEAALVAAGIEEHVLWRHPGRPTTTKTRLMAQHQQVARMDVEDRDPLHPDVEERAVAWAQAAPPRWDACVLSDYAKGAVTGRVAAAFLENARAAGRPSVVDPKGSSFEKYRGAAVITPNAHELEVAVGREVAGPESLERAAAEVLGGLPGTALLVTRGAEGMSLFRTDAAPVHFPATARNVYDVTGAGDTVVGTLALALAAGADLETAAWLANRAAGVAVGKLGTCVVAPDELMSALTEEPSRRRLLASAQS